MVGGGLVVVVVVVVVVVFVAVVVVVVVVVGSGGDSDSGRGAECFDCFTASLCLVVFAVDLLRSSAVAAVWEFQG